MGGEGMAFPPSLPEVGGGPACPRAESRVVARASPLGRPFADLRVWDQGQGLVPGGEAARRARGQADHLAPLGSRCEHGAGEGLDPEIWPLLCDRKREGSHYWPVPVVTLAGEPGA